MGRGHFKIDTTFIIGMLIDRVSKHLPKGARVVSWEYEGEISDVTLFVEHASIPDGSAVVNPELGTAFIVLTCDRCDGKHHKPGDELVPYDGVANGGGGEYCHHCIGEFQMEE